MTATDIAIRLLAALMAGGLIGFDRSARDRIAGLRTTMLMCLATTSAIGERIRAAGYTISSFAVRYGELRRIECHLEWYSAKAQDQTPELVEQLADEAGVLAVDWKPVNAGHLFE